MKKILNIIKDNKIKVVLIVVFVLIIIGYITFHKNSPYQFVTVQKGSIVETVSLTGNTIPSQSVSLAFGSSGIVSNTYSDLGKRVYKGQVLAELNMSDLVSQLHNAQAGLIIAEQHVSASKNNVENVTAQQNTLVETAYQNLLNSSLEAIPSDSGKDYTAPTISGNYVLGEEGTLKIKLYYSLGGVGFNVSGLSSGSGSCNTIISQPLGDSGLYIKCPTDIINTEDWIVEIPNKRATDYLANYNAYQLALQTRDKAIADAEANVGNADFSLVSNAQIAQAKASVDSIIAKIQNAKIIAPISGIITQFDAKIGQFTSQNVPLISVMSDSGYEIDSGVSETDIGKILIGNKVKMTLDAFPNETFMGSVFYIAPAETNTGGVISYQVKISFDTLDSRLKSGLTANINIQTKNKDNVLILPQYAILQNDEGTYVEIVDNDKIKQNSVVLGITDQKGNVEVISGVTEGEQVLNIGLKNK